MTVLAIILLVILIITYRKLSAAKKDLQAAQESLGVVSDANAYRDKMRAEAVQLREEADGLLSQAKKDATDTVDAAKREAASVREEMNKLKTEKRALEQELDALRLDAKVGMVSIDAYADLSSDEVKNKLVLLQNGQAEMVRNDSALEVTSSEAKKIVNSQEKQILRCFNAECSNIIEKVTAKNVDTARAKIQRAFDAINKIFAVDGVQITPDYLASKFEELSLVYAYAVKQEEEREQRKAIREQMVEEEKVRREIEREKQKIEKETIHFSNEVNKLMTYMQKAKDDVERQLYMDKVAALEEKLKELEASKENVLQREQNTRAGFVYIISNIGSFGEEVFKIGMTRRLEPMDRIAELSSASVPFPFDVHALIFSEDAPALEAILHRHFDSMRVNKVNNRKEFFRVGLDEIKKVVLDNHNATVKFIDIPDATEYRETLKLEPASV